MFKILEMILPALILGRILRQARPVEVIFRSAFTPLLDPMLHRHSSFSGMTGRSDLGPLFIAEISPFSPPRRHEYLLNVGLLKDG